MANRSARVRIASTLIFALGGLAGCATPAQKFDQAAAALGFKRDVIEGAGFMHVVFGRKTPNAGPTLHVYLDGDGSPFSNERPSTDPTPRGTITLQLLAQDPGPAVYVGRACYHGPAPPSACHTDHWTSARYSEPVVASLAVAIRFLVNAGDFQQLVLFGYSGGGTLAVLLAERLPQTRAVITVGANLDIDTWADDHAIPRLSASLNPASRHALAGVFVRHYVGSADRVVRPEIVAAAAAISGAQTRVIEGFDHTCCWVSLWPTILALPPIRH